LFGLEPKYESGSADRETKVHPSTFYINVAWMKAAFPDISWVIPEEEICMVFSQ